MRQAHTSGAHLCRHTRCGHGCGLLRAALRTTLCAAGAERPRGRLFGRDHSTLCPSRLPPLHPQALLLGMDAASQEPVLGLLGLLSETGEVSTSQMSKVGGGTPC